MFTVELYAGIRRAVMVDGISRREAASFDAVLRQPDDVRGPPRGRKKGVWRRRKKRSIIAPPWETPNRGKFTAHIFINTSPRGYPCNKIALTSRLQR